MELETIRIEDLPATVYVASAWWQFCDAFVCACGANENAVIRAIEESIEEERDRATDGLEEGEELTDEIMWSGTFPEKVTQEFFDDLTEESRQDLLDGQITYLTVG